MSLKKLFFLFLAILYSIPVSPRVAEEELPQEVPTGNFALPGSQRPSPLLGFGQNVVDKNTLIGLLETDFIRGPKNGSTTVIPQVLYGITDNFSIIVEFPIAAQFKDSGFSSSGPSDFFAQCEYAFYHTGTSTATKMLTFVASMLFPIGNYKKIPATGFGSPSFFLGITASRMATEWYCFTSYGALLTTQHSHHTKAGNNFFYQAGFGKNISYKTDKWLLTWMLELNGIYQQKAKIRGISDQNSQSNVIFVGPSLWLSTQDFFIHFGVAPVAYQQHAGIQTKTKFWVSLLTGWKFH